jgi:hypothetical protein
VSDENPYIFPMTRNIALTANFELGTATYTLTVIAGNNGTTSPKNSSKVETGTTVELTATADAGYRFRNWTENGIVSSKDNPYILTIVGNRTITANFEKDIVLGELDDITITNIDTVRATFSGILLSTGGADSGELGFVYSIWNNPLLNGAGVSTAKVNAVNLGTFSTTVSNLKPNTIYNVKAYFKNSEGITYSNQESFTTEKSTSISEFIRNSAINISPNPTSTTATVSFDLEKSCTVKIVLTDITGSELFEVYNGFENTGAFTKSITTDNLSKGIYLLKVVIGKDFTVEKFVVE